MLWWFLKVGLMMPAQFDLKITGLDKALDRIAKAPDEIKLKGLRFAMRKAANLVRDAAKQGAQAIDDPATGQSIADNIVVRFSGRRFRRTGDVMFRVGVLHGARLDKASPGKEPRSPTPHWRLIEFGTSRSRAQPFMAPALRNNVGSATNEAGKHLSRWLDRNYGGDR